jgi:hypothetical protein
MAGKSEKDSSLPPPTLAPSKSFPIDLVDVAAEIQAADETLGTMTSAKLRVIADQIRALQQQARQVLENAQQASELHRARCPFPKRAGHIYHLYRESDGSLTFSMLSPEDWNGRPPHEFVGSYRLEQDMSWTPLEHVAERDADEALVQRLLHSGGNDPEE